MLFILCSPNCRGQVLDSDLDKWMEKLSDKSPKGNDCADDLIIYLGQNEQHANHILKVLGKQMNSRNYHYQARYNYVLASLIFKKNLSPSFGDNTTIPNSNDVRPRLIKLYTQAINIAYESDDDKLIAFISYKFGSSIIRFGEIGLSVMYTKNAIEIYDSLGLDVGPEGYKFLAEILYKVREYDESIQYAKKAFETFQYSPGETDRPAINSLNTIALGFGKLQQVDSATYYYKEAMELAEKSNDSVWVGIISGNLGQINYQKGQYEDAYEKLNKDYLISKNSGYYDNAANSLQWAARTNLAMGNRYEALDQVKEAFKLLKLWPNESYQNNSYYTAYQIFKEMGNSDSAYYYNDLYINLNNSIEREVATSSLSIAKAKLNDERSRYKIENIRIEGRSQILLRNVIIVGIVLISLIALALVNRMRLASFLKLQRAEQEKGIVLKERAFAEEQLKMFTDSIIEKTNLIDKLEQQVKRNEMIFNQNTIISELGKQTILTDDDWFKFKSLFETAYPGFFIKLKQEFPEITSAEQRMAALTRLELTTKQISSILGISVDSVHKSRQRLRKRLNLKTDANLAELVSKM